ncbi:hypothetical protein [Methylomonas methanica]|uniref:hypothetical protein n=1 Tax=Methylomonas methanica TaxID=421 RepID=UPI00059E32EF|nr:hypothetical protein [Methylomonas methanica]
MPGFVAQNTVVDQIREIESKIQCLEAIYQQKLAALNELKKSLLHQVSAASFKPQGTANAQVDLFERVVHNLSCHRHIREATMQTSTDDEAIRAFCADRLSKTIDETADVAEQAGMTPEILEQLLADES